MKYASSIRYGGQLVKAVDCDYQDYKHLGLLCPNCKDPVFLQGESSRILGEKTISIPPHFKHFTAKDAPLVKQCEARVAKYDQKELKRRAIKTRNQRLQILQKFFWKIIETNPYTPKYNELEALKKMIIEETAAKEQFTEWLNQGRQNRRKSKGIGRWLP